MNTRAQRFLPAITLITALVVTACVYWVGLRGPFLFDDHHIFPILESWMRGKATLRQVVAGNTSFLMHRGLSMASFALNIRLLDYSPYAFKLVNLLIHLLTGIAAYLFAAALLRRDQKLAPHGQWIALLVATIWLLHPFNVSTVLYAVQRMSQIAALFVLLGLYLYIRIRTAIEERSSVLLWMSLYATISLLTLLAIQGKQTGAILPALCFLVELFYFRSLRSWKLSLIAFYAIFLALPFVAGLTALVLRPEFLMRAYGDYDFSPWQRLISEARVLCDYLRMILVPYTPAMGVYTDDYAASRSLLSPPTTLACVAILVGISAIALRCRRTIPAFAFGWFFFLAGHVIEGTIVPIELYYEHRNYLPSIGIILACAALIRAGLDAASRNRIEFRARVVTVVALALVLSLALQTHGRARVWSDRQVLAESALQNHPKSARAIITYLGTALDAGDNARAYAVASDVIHSNDRRLSALISLFKIRMDCVLTGRGSPSDLARAVSSLSQHVDLSVALMFRYVGVVIGNQSCKGISQSEIASAMVRVADRATLQRDDAQPKVMLRHGAAVFYALAGNWEASLAQAQLAWKASTELPAVAQLIQALLAADRISDAEKVLMEATRRAGKNPSPEDRSRLRVLKQMIEERRAKVQSEAS